VRACLRLIPASYKTIDHVSNSVFPSIEKSFLLITNLELLKGEATTSTKLGVVLDGGATDSWAKKAINGSRSDASSLLDACNSSRLLATGLIEPGLDTALPVLTEMLIGQLIVVFQNHCSTVWLDFASK
jgi:hypothetical protein